MHINLTAGHHGNANNLPTSISIFCGTVIFIIALTGLLAYMLFIAIALGKNDFKESSYFTMAGWLGVADCICLVLMITYAAPSIILQRDLSDSRLIGGLLNIGWFTGLPLLLFLAVNRYLCICHTDLYKRWFTLHKTRCYCVIALSFGTLYSIPSFMDYSPLFFDYRMLSWQWDLFHHPVAKVVSIGEITIVMAVTLITYSLNTLVFKEIHSVNKQSALGGIQHGRDASWERKMFIQFFVTTLWLPVFDLPFISLSYIRDPSPWLGYFVTIAYTLNCSVNGWVYIIMNNMVRKSIKDMVTRCKSKNTIATTTNTQVLPTTSFINGMASRTC